MVSSLAQCDRESPMEVVVVVHEEDGVCFEELLQESS